VLDGISKKQWSISMDQWMTRIFKLLGDEGEADVLALKKLGAAMATSFGLGDDLLLFEKW